MIEETKLELQNYLQPGAFESLKPLTVLQQHIGTLGKSELFHV